jgi:hypothetical protein
VTARGGLRVRVRVPTGPATQSYGGPRFKLAAVGPGIKRLQPPVLRGDSGRGGHGIRASESLTGTRGGATVTRRRHGPPVPVRSIVRGVPRTAAVEAGGVSARLPATRPRPPVGPPRPSVPPYNPHTTCASPFPHPPTHPSTHPPTRRRRRERRTGPGSGEMPG